jgi:hypothetical protein
MSAREQIADLLQQWREVSQTEFAAIQAGDWTQLRALQAAKETIQRKLTEARQTWNAENPTQPLPAAAGNPFAEQVNNLLTLETRKVQFLEARRQRLRDRQGMLRQARTNVRRLRSSYAGSAAPKWHSYS